MHQIKDIEPEISFVDMKSGLKLSIINIISVQFIFQIIAILFIQIISYFQITVSLSILNPKGLNIFAWDMWLMVILLSVFLVGRSLLYKIKVIPLYSLIIYPAILVMFSMVRDVSSIQVITFSILSYAVVLKINYQKIKQLEFTKV